MSIPDTKLLATLTTSFELYEHWGLEHTMEVLHDQVSRASAYILNGEYPVQLLMWIEHKKEWLKNKGIDHGL